MTRSVRITEDERNISRKAITKRLKQCYVTEISILATSPSDRVFLERGKSSNDYKIDHYQVRIIIWDHMTE